MIENLNEKEMRAILDLAVIAESQNIRLMLIGANARRLSFDIPFGFESPRTTQDWDFAAPMKSWEVFARFYQRAVHDAMAPFEPGESGHRIIHRATRILVDLVPFGPLTEAGGKIRWPQSEQVMSVLGFDEAYESCTHIKLLNGVEIGIVTPALLAALKVIAYAERGKESLRDLPDLWFIMERYARPSAHENRVFEEMAGLFPDASYYDHFNSLLLGWDIGRQCRPSTLAAIDPVLHELSSVESLKIESLLPRTGDEHERETQRGRIASEFGWLLKGIGLGRNSKAS
jgi:predicted nucleotidyltransferase